MADEKKAPDTEHPEEAQKQPKKGNNKKLLIIIIGCVALVLVAGGGFIAYSKFFKEKGKTEEAANHEGKGKGKSVLIPVDQFVVNLTEQGRYLKVTIQFEVADADSQNIVTQKMPNLRDAIITLLSSKSAAAVSGPEEKFQLKDEILLRANQAVGQDIFKNLFFTEFIMQ
jgi:flagellar FliL protein